jgi:ADP-heptose:LPS heptosyltransferase
MIRQLKVLNIEVSSVKATDMSFPLPTEVDKKVDTILQSHDIQPENDFTVAIAPGVLKPHHRWIMSRFAKLIELILQEDSNTKILLVGAPADIKDTNEVLEQLNKSKRIINLVGKTNFMEALGVMKFCKILITCDGGIVYIAAAMGCSTISIWGPGVMDRFKPPGSDHIGIQKDYFCIPCVNYSRLGEFPPCPYDRRCINDITPEDVFEKYVELKNRKRSNFKDNKGIKKLYG